MAKKKREAEVEKESTARLETEEVTTPPDRDWLWLGSCVAITVLATALRFIALDLKPFHHDEGVNGFFLTELFRKGTYH